MLKQRIKRTLHAARRRAKSLVSGKAERRHSWVGRPDLWKMKRDFQFAYLTQQGLRPQHRMCDIGCGTLRGGIPFISYLETGHYTGIEVREEVMQEGRRELTEAGLDSKAPHLVVSDDMAALRLDTRFDYVWSFSVLIHMSDEILAGTLDFVARHLAQDGVFYANVRIGARDDGGWQGFPVVTRPMSFYEEACAAVGLSVAVIGPLRDLGHVTGNDGQDGQIMMRIERAA